MTDPEQEKAMCPDCGLLFRYVDSKGEARCWGQGSDACRVRTITRLRAELARKDERIAELEREREEWAFDGWNDPDA